MIVLGVDPGRTTGWAVLEIAARATVLSHGLLAFEAHETPEVWAASGEADDWLAGVMASHVAGSERLMVAMESPAVVRPRAASGGVTPSMASGLLFAKGVAVALAGAAHGLSRWCDLRHCEAAAWRQRVAGKANASDAEVKAALLRLVRAGQLASLPATNAHVRDAIGVALWASWGSR